MKNLATTLIPITSGVHPRRQLATSSKGESFLCPIPTSSPQSPCYLVEGSSSLEARCKLRFWSSSSSSSHSKGVTQKTTSLAAPPVPYGFEYMNLQERLKTPSAQQYHKSVASTVFEVAGTDSSTTRRQRLLVGTHSTNTRAPRNSRHMD